MEAPNYLGRPETGSELKVTQVEQKLNAVHQYSDIVLSMAVRLDARLHLVTRPSMPRLDREQSNQKDNTAPLADSLESIMIKLITVEDILESIFERLEV